jgi:hypothetical protein
MAAELTTSPAKGGKGKGRGRGKSEGEDLSVSPVSVTLEPNTVQRFTAAGGDGSTVAPAVHWSASGGTIDSTGRYTAGRTPGQYHVIATTSDGLADTAQATVVPDAPVLDRVTISPAMASVIAGETQQFSAVGKASDGSSIAIDPAYSASGGTITQGGLYTAGETAGTYRVIVTDVASGKADTASVTITTASPTLQALVLTPATVSLSAGETQQFTASGRTSDGTTTAITATFTATGGTITPSGLYTAGSTAGTFRVTATQSGGSLADTAAVTVSVPSPTPTNGHTYFLADAESGSVVPPFLSWGVYCNGAASCPVSSTTRPKRGTRSFRFEITDPGYGPSSSSSLSTNLPQSSMGCARGHFCSGWYSAWNYIDAGWDNSTWNVLYNFLATLPVGDPIGHVGLSIRDGQRQLYWYMKNCESGRHYTCPNISGYGRSGAEYYMTSSSPAGVVSFPKGQWVHVAVYYQMSRTNGRIQIWQDGVKLFDLTAPTLNTLDGHSNYDNTGGDLMFGWGIYQGPNPDGVRRMYGDDFRVTDYRPVP